MSNLKDYKWTLIVKGGPGSGFHGHAGRPGLVGGSGGGSGGEDSGSHSFTREQFVGQDGEMRPPGELSDLLGLWDRGGYTPGKKVPFRVEGIKYDFNGWLTSGRGRQNQSTYMHIEKITPLNIFNPETGERRPTGTMGSIHYSAKWPSGKWKEILG